jgi:hypothetical protein
MPRTRKFFRLKNSSKDSGLSFHCCGKPEDLLDEPLDLVNQKRQPRGKAEVTKPETKISVCQFDFHSCHSPPTKPLPLSHNILQERDFDARLVATLCHEHRLMKEKRSHESHPSAPGSSSNWPLQSLLFRSTASSSNLKRKSRVERTKLWAKKYIDPHINDKSLANEESEYSRSLKG